MRVAVATLLIISLCLSSCMQQKNFLHGSLTDSYRKAINEAATSSRFDRTPELYRCLELWNSVGRFKSNLVTARLENVYPVVFLEIGNSGFPRYDFILIEGSHMKSSLGGERSIAETDLAIAISKAIESIDSIAGRVASESDDADCYFLTIQTARVRKTVAYYGLPSSEFISGSLISEMYREAAN